MSEAREALKQAKVAKDAPRSAAKSPQPRPDKADTDEYRRAVASINRASEQDMERALAR
jgi:hypothetical protein